MSQEVTIVFSRQEVERLQEVVLQVAWPGTIVEIGATIKSKLISALNAPSEETKHEAQDHGGRPAL